MLLLVLAPVTVYLTRTSLAFLPRGARRWSLGLRLVIIALAVAALSGVGVVRADQRLSVVFLLDRSGSVSTQEQAAQTAYVREAVAALKPGDQAGVVAFGANALVDRPVLPDKTPPDLQSAPATTYTNIDDALRLGLAVAPADTSRRLVLLSDGRENLGNAEWAARMSAAGGVPIDIVPLPIESGPEVWVNSLKAPSPVRENERVSLEIGITSSTDTTATLLLSVDGNALGSQAVSLTRGANSFVQSLPPIAKGFHTYSAQLVVPPGADTRRENNRYSAFSLVLGKPRVLVVEGHAGEAGALLAAIAPSVDADLVAPEAMPADLRALAGYGGVALVNVPATAPSRKALENLQVAVRDLGKGLVVIGGDESYAAGGYFRTPLEAMLPVDLNLPSKLDIPTVAMLLVIDRSGSMAEGHSVNGVGVTKIALAKEAAYQATAQLGERDYVGVISFDSAASWVVELQPLGDPAQFQGKIGGITANGGTNIYSGLAPAVEALVANNARSKHIILLTDGISEGGNYAKLLEQMAANNITLSTVAVGSDADQGFLQNLATAGKGRFYYTEQGDALPQIFAHESHIAARSYIIEHPLAPKRTSPSPILDGLGGLPDLQGYVGTSPRPAGQVVLVSDAGDPLLAQWQYGLGRVVAWTSDAKGQWAKDWVAWPDFPRFWTQALRWSTGAEAGNALQPRIELEGGMAHITVDAAQPDGSFLSNLNVGAQIVSPSLLTSSVTLRQSAAGRYEGSFPATEEGAYLLRVQAQGQGLGSTAQTMGVVVPYSPEYRGTPADNGLLSRLASLTGGRVLALDNPTAALEHNLPAASSATDLWPLLLLFAILLLPFDIGVRRVALSRGDLVRAREASLGRLGRRRRAMPALQTATPQTAALLTAKERSRERLKPEPPPAPAGRQPEHTAWERGLQIEGRTGRQASIVAPPPPPTPPQTQPARQPEEETEDGLAARLRKSREQRH